MNTKIKTLRTYLHLSQAAFAEPLNLSPTHIARFEKGTSLVPPAVVDKICDGFGVDPLYFSTDMPVEKAVKVESEDEKNRAIGARLKAIREEKGWSQLELGKKSGVNQATISRVEDGEKLSEKAGRRLAEALEVGYDWLMKGDLSRRAFPADQRLIDWLWRNEEVREELWKKMKNYGQATTVD